MNHTRTPISIAVFTCDCARPDQTYFVETYEPSGPFGNKGLAEPPLIPQAPAIRNAILHATGVGVRKLPMNPQNLVHAFIEAGLIEA